MIVNEQYIEILDQSEQLGAIILQSDVMQDYKNAKIELQYDQTAQGLIRDFVNIKDDYEDVKRFGRYHPDYNEIMKNVRATKRKMDLNEKVAQFKVAERNIQRLLDDVSEVIANSVSENIKVPKDGAALTDSGCGCGSGNGCGCQAS
ncbi:YlbF family regulator [Cerasibacillus terrae]|uniref:YlbF family regulator n=1 Tax=Cerasibacillus terrae TaxID=2498845 RepID=A0A5C8P1V4_9BACI|nr:YlbF family regulator [Cerasibacillus terrae]TXL67579.1 YlbF family regulator [Cerasibacillus terrae]